MLQSSPLRAAVALVLAIFCPTIAADECDDLRASIDLEIVFGGPEFAKREKLRATFDRAMDVTEAHPAALPGAFAAYRSLAEATNLIKGDFEGNQRMFFRALLAAYEVSNLSNCVLGERKKGG